MHRALVVLMVIMLPGCGGQQQSQRVGEAHPEVMALGWVDRTVLEQPQFSQFKSNYDSAQVDQEMVSLIRQVSDSVDWLVFFGSWCGDSKEHVPRFLKIADVAGISNKRIRLYGLDRSMKSTEGLEKKYQIRSVPTFICLKAGKEIGRITEAPTVSMEADILAILAAAP